jgi:hypothetical protein
MKYDKSGTFIRTTEMATGKHDQLAASYLLPTCATSLQQ